MNACIGLVEGDNGPVEAYLASGGDPARQLTHSEVLALNRNSAFDVGYTLVHLAIRQVKFTYVTLKLYLRKQIAYNSIINLYLL